MAGSAEYKVQLELLGKNLDQLNRTSKDMKGLQQQTNSLQQMFKLGLSIDFAGRFTQGIGQIKDSFTGAIRRGVDFNRTMFDAEVGISNVLKKFLELDDVAAKKEAAKAMQAIIALEPKTAAGVADLVEGFLATVASAQAAGVAVAENIDLVGKFANATANANIPAEQLSQELRAIFTGNITPDAALAKILQITNEDVRNAVEAGELYQFLNEQVGSLGESGDSAAVRLSTLNSAVDKLLAEITEPVFDTWLTGLGEMTETVNNPELLDSLQAIGLMLGDLTAAGFDLTEWAVDNADALVLLAQAAAALGSAYVAIKFRELLVNAGASTQAWWAGRVAVEAQTASLARNTLALSANAAARLRFAQAGRLAATSFAAGGGFGAVAGGVFSAGGVAALVVGHQIIKGIEASTLARLEAEDKINEAYAERERLRNAEIAALSSTEAKVEQRAKLEAELAETQAKIAQAQDAAESTAATLGMANNFAALYGASKTSEEIENTRELTNLLVEQERIRADLAVIDSRGDEIVETNRAKVEANELLERQTELYETATKRAEELAAKVLALREAYAMGALDDPGQLAFLQGKVEQINAALAEQVASYATLPDDAQRTAIIEDARLQAEEKRLPLLEAIRSLQAAIAKEAESALETAEKEAQEQREKADAIERGLAALRLSQVDTAIGAINANPFATEAQKADQRVPLLRQKETLLTDEAVDIGGQLEGGVTDVETRLALETRLNDILTEQVGIQRELAVSSFGGEFREEMTAWLDSFGSNAEQVAGILTGTLGAGIDAISTQLTAAILQTQSWGDAWRNIGLAVVQTLLQMVIRYAAARAAMFVVSRLYGAAETTALAAQAGATAVAWAPAATAASIATFGAAAGVGTAAYLAGLATGTAGTAAFAAIPAFADGGIFRGAGGDRDDANLIRVSNNEGIVQAAAIRHYGEDFFNAFNNMTLGTAPVGARNVPTGAPLQGAGNAVASGGSRSPNITIIPVASEREANRIARHSEARGDIVRIVREERDQIFGDEF